MFEELLKKIREYLSLKAQEKAFHDSCTGTHYGFPYQKIKEAEADFEGLLTKIIDERVQEILDAKESASQGMISGNNFHEQSNRKTRRQP